MQLNKCADGRAVNNMQASSKHMCENPKVFIQPEPEFPALTSSVCPTTPPSSVQCRVHWSNPGGAAGRPAAVKLSAWGGYVIFQVQTMMASL